MGSFRQITSVWIESAPKTAGMLNMLGGEAKEGGGCLHVHLNISQCTDSDEILGHTCNGVGCSACHYITLDLSWRKIMNCFRSEKKDEVIPRKCETDTTMCLLCLTDMPCAVEWPRTLPHASHQVVLFAYTLVIVTPTPRASV